jgi:FixJ family two-component response regulator
MTDTDVAMVFVVDDDPQVRASIQGLLKLAGLRSECFETPEQFLQRQPPGGPSCLIVDVSLPGISGLDFQQQLKNKGVQIPIVFINPNAEVYFFDTGHFALETHHREIGETIRKFLNRTLPAEVHAG